MSPLGQLLYPVALHCRNMLMNIDDRRRRYFQSFSFSDRIYPTKLSSLVCHVSSITIPYFSHLICRRFLSEELRNRYVIIDCLYSRWIMIPVILLNGVHFFSYYYAQYNDRRREERNRPSPPTTQQIRISSMVDRQRIMHPIRDAGENRMNRILRLVEEQNTSLQQTINDQMKLLHTKESQLRQKEKKIDNQLTIIQQQHIYIQSLKEKTCKISSLRPTPISIGQSPLLTHNQLNDSTPNSFHMITPVDGNGSKSKKQNNDSPSFSLINEPSVHSMHSSDSDGKKKTLFDRI